jgi:hypothetical protein
MSTSMTVKEEGEKDITCHHDLSYARHGSRTLKSLAKPPASAFDGSTWQREAGKMLEEEQARTERTYKGSSPILGSIVYTTVNKNFTSNINDNSVHLSCAPLAINASRRAC